MQSVSIKPGVSSTQQLGSRSARAAQKPVCGLCCPFPTVVLSSASPSPSCLLLLNTGFNMFAPPPTTFLCCSSLSIADSLSLALASEEREAKTVFSSQFPQKTLLGARPHAAPEQLFSLHFDEKARREPHQRSRPCTFDLNLSRTR